MSTNEKHALITGSSCGIGRAVALKLAESGIKVAIHYYQNEEAAQDTLARVPACGSDGIVIQADVLHPEEISRLFDRVEAAFGTLDIFVNNPRPDLPAFYRSPMDITLDHWQAALDSQARAFLLGVQAAARCISDGGRIIAITYSPSGRTGSWRPWVAMGSAKAALDSLVRYFAVALGKRGITVNGVSPGGASAPPTRSRVGC